ncbi:hypothetical protein [Streptomyces californicus]|uniref:MmyB family transcriptional regulator n=1 Tax=Streptomyces californicus TaxID=67351 RepID=UPI003795F0C1
MSQCERGRPGAPQPPTRPVRATAQFTRRASTSGAPTRLYVLPGQRAAHNSGTKQIRHPDVGDLEFVCEAVNLPDHPGWTMFAYTSAAGSPPKNASNSSAASPPRPPGHSPQQPGTARTACGPASDNKPAHVTTIVRRLMLSCATGP